MFLFRKSLHVRGEREIERGREREGERKTKWYMRLIIMKIYSDKRKKVGKQGREVILGQNM
jgi:hypothetical protein